MSEAGPVPAFRQQGANVRRADRIHRSSLFGVFNRISAEHEQGLAQVEAMLVLLLGFAEKNRA
ncbi:MAG: hypothetical protein WDN04_10665 [Rhodospirillales bacterium]